MKRLHKAVISFGIVAILMSGSSSVFARSETTKARTISGSIVRIDRTTRTITIRERATGEPVQVRVPDGATIRTNHVGLSSVNFEQLLTGMFVRDVRVQ